MSDHPAVAHWGRWSTLCKCVHVYIYILYICLICGYINMYAYMYSVGLLAYFSASEDACFSLNHSFVHKFIQ